MSVATKTMFLPAAAFGPRVGPSQVVTGATAFSTTVRASASTGSSAASRAVGAAANQSGARDDQEERQDGDGGNVNDGDWTRGLSWVGQGRGGGGFLRGRMASAGRGQTLWPAWLSRIRRRAA